MASSVSAVKQTLQTILERLLKIKDGIPTNELQIEECLDEDAYESLEEESEESTLLEHHEMTDEETIDIDELNKEIEEISYFLTLANDITIETKSRALLEAIQTGFQETEIRGGSRKALIFTESTRTQKYLKSYLEDNGYSGKVCIFNGSNSSPEVSKIYNDWKEKNINNGRISGSVVADKRNAIIEYFRDSAEILIATESAAEGVNLQFCSLVINYDLPWNPQRIEQRIGRCHRYGQKNDVVVINFINKRNQADVRVHELLDEKFNLFRGVFGSSDEVLGTIESGVDFEQKILEIYQCCRTPAEIDFEFDKLQKEMEQKISAGMKSATDKLFKEFDSDVHERLKISVKEYLDRYAIYFWALSKFVLQDIAEFNDNEKIILLKETIDNIQPCKLKLVNHSNENNVELFRMNHPLGQFVLDKALECDTNISKIVFDITAHKGYKLSQVEQLKGKSGYLSLSKLTINSLENEEYLLFVGCQKDGTFIDAEQCRKLFDCEGISLETKIPDEFISLLDRESNLYRDGTLEKINLKNLDYIRVEESQLDKWAEDKINSLEQELMQVKKNIRDAERCLRTAISTNEHLELHERINKLNKKKISLRNNLEKNEDEIQIKRDKLINTIREQSKTTSSFEKIFTIEWEVV